MTHLPLGPRIVRLVRLWLAASLALSFQVRLSPAVAQEATPAAGPNNQIFLPLISRSDGRLPSKIPDVVGGRAAQVEAALRASGSNTLTPQQAAQLSDSLMRVSTAGEVLVELHAARDITPADLASLQAIGARVVVSTGSLTWPRGMQKPANLGIVLAWVPYNQFASLPKNLSWLVAVTPAEDTEPDVGPNLSEGVALHNADDVQAGGINGAGVNVGVISDGVSNLAAAQPGGGTGDLPAAVTVLNAGSGDEGTAMLEIIHDMAPGAQLFFNATGGGVANHIAAQNALVAAGVNVIAEDIPFDTEPAFQRGAAAANGDAVAAAGVSMHSSAGNLGSRHSARVNAVGTGNGPDGFNGPFGGCPFNPTNAVAIAPGGDTTFDVTLIGGATSRFTLQWSEPRAIFPTAGAGGFTNLDLFIMDATGRNCLGTSTNVQGNGAGDTIEIVAMANPAANTRAKVVVHVSGIAGAVTPPVLDLRWRGANAVDASTRNGSLNPDSNYLGPATSSAAADAGASTNLNTVALEPFSAGGPVQLLLTTTCPGAFPCPGSSVAGPAATTRNAPDWTAADGVDVSGVGGFGSPFFGTSAAAPHAAACDVLVRDSLNAAATVPLVTTQLIAGAVDRDAPGPDTQWGAGVLDCFRAIFPTARPGGPYVTPEGQNINLNGTASSAPGGGPVQCDWDLDNNGTFEVVNNCTPVFDRVGQDGVFTIRLRVRDVNGLAGTANGAVTVTNVAPDITVSSAPTPENSALTVNGSVTDPGWLDPLSATIDWGDGSPVQAIAGVLENVRPDATLTFNIAHTYGDNGVYGIKVCARDDDVTVCENTAVFVTNVNPTAELDKSGAVIVDGVLTLITNVGDTVTFNARSRDPGSDDLRFSWDWIADTFVLFPNAVSTSLVNPPAFDPYLSPSIQPRDVTDSQTREMYTPCHFVITLGVTDDDGGSSLDTLDVIIQGTSAVTLTADEWLARYRSATPEGALARPLGVVQHMSATFRNQPTLTVEAATTILSDTATPQARWQRQVLTAWLNFASGAVAYAEPVDTNHDGVADTTFAAFMAAVETARDVTQIAGLSNLNR